MGAMNVAARVSELTARQWGLLTTAQAEEEGVTRLQLARLADAGVIERVDRGIYAAPSAVDERTPLRAAWLSLDPKTLAEERLSDPIASGVLSHTSAAALHEVGDLLDDEPEITVPARRQSRRGIRLHRGVLGADDVTIVGGLPVTTPERTLADLLRDGRDPSHIAEIAGEMLRRGLVSRQDMALALDPLARRNGQPTGAALLEHLLDLVGLSGAALATNLAASDLGKALVAAGQLDAIRNIMEAVAQLDLPNSVFSARESAAMSAIAHSAALQAFPDGVIPKIDVSALIDAMKFSIPVDTDAFRSALAVSVADWLPEVIQSIPAESWSQSVTPAGADSDEASP